MDSFPEVRAVIANNERNLRRFAFYLQRLPAPRDGPGEARQTATQPAKTADQAGPQVQRNVRFRCAGGYSPSGGRDLPGANGFSDAPQGGRSMKRKTTAVLAAGALAFAATTPALASTSPGLKGL